MLDKHFDPQKIEKRLYDKWESSGAFRADPESSKNPFTIMIPPPNVTGALHIGHALTMTIQDVLTRYHRMKGFDALWQPGTDHAGIATQMVVERKLEADGGPGRKALGREAFIEKVWEWKEESGNTITKQLRRLGTSPDWERERFTMDEGLSKAVRKIFVQLYKDGLLYKDNRLVNWDPKLHTAVSDLEVEQREVKGHMWHIRYPLEGDVESYITIATTRPETLLGDTAIAVHPDDERYKHLIGKFAVLPIVGRPIPIVADEHSDPEKGSGAVKITPAHDFNDFEVGKRHDLPMINIFDKSACINENAPEEYQGLDRFEARKKILAELEELDFLVEVEKITHSVPYDEKSKKTVIEPFLTEQWYVDAKTLAKPALEAVRTGKTEFVPKQWENTFFHWLENIQPWCVSRQLWWGHQIPAWYDNDGKLYVAESLKEAQEQAGEGVQLIQDEDVLDTWFSSALWPFSTLGWPDKTPELDKYYPGNVLVTGFDIIFFWVARMMMMGIYTMGETPFAKVYMHGLVRDEKGQKMSKTKGNVIDPLVLVDKYGADTLRFTMIAMAAQGRDIRLSEQRVEGYRNFTTKIWNAARYCEMNGCLPNAEFGPSSVSSTLNKWIISETLQAKKNIEDALAAYKFNESANAVYQFIWNIFCDWYLEFTKPLLGEDNKNDALKQETRDTTGWVLDQILTLLNPFMPFITETIYESIAARDEKVLITGDWPNYDDGLVSTTAETEVNWIMKIITAIRSVRADMNVPAGAKIELIHKDASDEAISYFNTHAEIIRRMARLTIISTLEGDIPSGSLQTVVDGTTLILPIAEFIDLDKERERLHKEIDKLNIEIKKISQKLENKKFIANAPAEVVEEQHTRKKDAESVIEKLNTALNQLQTAA